MPHFEIHGDDQNGITIRHGQYEQHYRLHDANFRTDKRVASWQYEFAPWRQILELAVEPLPPAPPEITEEGIWLH